MKVILLTDVKKLGEKDKVIEVSDGFARNFLFAKKLAVPATPGHLKSLEEKKHQQGKKIERHNQSLESICEEISKKHFTIKAKSGEGGKLFGSVTAHDLAEMIKKDTGIDYDKRWIQMEEPLKHLGEHKVRVRYAAVISGEINVEIVPENH